MSGLLQALLEQTAELPQPDERKQTLSLVNMDAFLRCVCLFVYNRPAVKTHFSVGPASVSPDFSQWLSEVFKLLDYWFKKLRYNPR